MLIETTAIVQDRIASDKSREETVAAGLPSKFERWVSPYTSTPRWITNLYDDLAD